MPGIASTIVTSVPWTLAAAATSAPMNPPPSTSTESARSRSAASWSESPSRRNVRTAGWSATIGGVAARAPVAITTTSASSRSPSVVSTPSAVTDATVHTTPQVDVERADLVLVGEEGEVGLAFAGQHLLRQRRPVVRELVLVAEDRDRCRRSRLCGSLSRCASRPDRRRRPAMTVARTGSCTLLWGGSDQG